MWLIEAGALKARDSANRVGSDQHQALEIRHILIFYSKHLEYMVGNSQYVLSDKQDCLLIRTGSKWFIPHCSVSLMIANGYASACLLKCLHTAAFSPILPYMVPGHLL